MKWIKFDDMKPPIGLSGAHSVLHMKRYETEPRPKKTYKNIRTGQVIEEGREILVCEINDWKLIKE